MKRKLTSYLFATMRLISLITGYNLILFENEFYFINGGRAAEHDYEIIKNATHSDSVFFVEDARKIKEHALETGPGKYYLKRPLPRFWQKILSQKEKPGYMAFPCGRVFERYRPIYL